MIGNSRIFIRNLLKPVSCDTDIKESCLFVAKIVVTLKKGRPGGLSKVSSHLDWFQNQERNNLKTVSRELYFKEPGKVLGLVS